MPAVRSFPPVADAKAAVLVLGSMPGAASLAAGQYYAHPRNQFWPIMAALCGGQPDAPYAARLRMLKGRRIALWDVLGSCVRPGSADAAIRRSSVRVNDFAAFFGAHPGIKAVFFNGSKAEECWRRRVAPALPASLASLRCRRLPSTSPAYASLSPARKLAAYKRAFSAELK
jgi:hypoxanthine-DNA glycosylase